MSIVKVDRVARRGSVGLAAAADWRYQTHEKKIDIFPCVCSMCVFHVRSFDFEITRMISAQIARHEVQLPLYYIHFEIALKKGLGQFKYFTDAVLS